MLGSDLESTADMISAQLFYKGVAFRVGHEVIISYSRTYEYFFDLIQFSHASQYIQIFLVIRLYGSADSGKQTISVSTYSLHSLSLARRASEVCRRSSHVMNISLEVFFLCQFFCFI